MYSREDLKALKVGKPDISPSVRINGSGGCAESPKSNVPIVKLGIFYLSQMK